MSDFENYLQSERAVEDARQLLAGPVAGVWHADVFDWWTCRASAAWRVVAIGLDHTYMESALGHVYFRAEGDHFIVTDLGEALQALRLRTGQLDWREPGYVRERVDEVCSDFSQPVQAVMDVDGAYGVIGARDVEHDLAVITAETLPVALCRVLLGAHRVMELQVP